MMVMGVSMLFYSYSTFALYADVLLLTLQIRIAVDVIRVRRRLRKLFSPRFLNDDHVETLTLLMLHCCCFHQGGAACAIEPSKMNFLNHGCNGTYNIGITLPFTEATLEAKPAGIFEAEEAYDPFNGRHFQATTCLEMKSLRDIQKGEELLDNYLAFGDENFFEANLAELKAMCSSGVGLVNAVEAGMPTEISFIENKSR